MVIDLQSMFYIREYSGGSGALDRFVGSRGKKEW